MPAPRTWLEKADRYLATAELLLADEDYESSVSRAYYAARYAAIHLLLARRTGYEQGWKHNTLTGRLVEQSRNLPWLRIVEMAGQKTFSRSWMKLVEDRSDADYEIGKIKVRTAQHCIEFAREVVRVIEENVP